MAFQTPPFQNILQLHELIRGSYLYYKGQYDFFPLCTDSCISTFFLSLSHHLHYTYIYMNALCNEEMAYSPMSKSPKYMTTIQFSWATTKDKVTCLAQGQKTENTHKNTFKQYLRISSVPGAPDLVWTNDGCLAGNGKWEWVLSLLKVRPQQWNIMFSHSGDGASWPPN